MTAARAPRRAALLALLALATLTACGDADPPPAAGPRPDLLLVVVDTLRADHLSAYGYPRPTSPGLERLAAEGVLFTDVTAQSSWTLPSMASLFSGRHLYVNARRLPSSVPSLAERLQAAGYETAAFVGNPAVNADGGYDRGFDHFVTREQTGGTTWDAPDLEAAVRAWLDAHPPGDAPRFLYLHYLDPHWPYAPAEDVDLPGAPHVRADSRAAWEAARDSDPAVAAGFDAARAGLLADIDAYDREVLVVDRSLERLLAETARERPRLVVVASDHGEGLWDHREHASLVAPPGGLRETFFRDHSYHMWRELLFTPLIVQGAGFPTGVVVDAPVQNVDIRATLLAAAGLPRDPQADGVPLQDVVAEPEASTDRWLAAHANEATMLRRADAPHKLVFPTDTGFSFGMPIQFYDLAADPGERSNLDESVRADRQHPLRATLQALYKEREQRAAAFDLYDDEPFTPSADQSAILEELGYVGEGFRGDDG